MKKLVFAAVALFAARANADGVSGRAQISYQSYDYGSNLTAGMRQQYDLRLEHALTGTSMMRVFFRGDDFQGSTKADFITHTNDFRQLQPGGELAINTDVLQAQVRADSFDTKSTANGVGDARTLDRRSGHLTWTPLSLPRVDLSAQRNRTNDTSSATNLTDEYANGTVSYDWRMLQLRGEGRYTHSFDPIAGFDQSTLMRGADVSYATSMLDGKLSIGGQGIAQFTRLKQSATSGSQVPLQIVISGAWYGVDETPNDDRDHPLVAAPPLIDNNLDASAGISLGPESQSFQNIAIDIGHLDRVDEIRVIVRDPSGNPLRNGGGPVTWDLYTSQDGVLWTGATSSNSFNAALSLYSITFPLDVGRWFKVVSFGVNSEATLVTEVQAFDHAQINPGARRDGNQNAYNATATVTYQPAKRLTLSYSSSYNSLRQDLANVPTTSTSDTEHLGGFEYRLFRAWAVRGQYLRRDVTTFAGSGDLATIMTGFLDYVPTEELRTSLEIGHQTETLDGTPFVIDTQALHITAYVLRSLLVTSDVGAQSQTISSDGSTAHRQFANMAVRAQLLPNVRAILTATLQRTRTDSTDPAVALLGPIRDERVTADILWRPGRQLSLQTVLGWASGEALHGFTQRYHAEWFPFGDGTVSLGGSYDQDIDPAANRKASRMMFTPRWAMNRSVAFDLNITRVRTTSDSITNQQKLLFATVTLSR